MAKHKRFPYIEAAGTNYEVGLVIGGKFKEIIQKSVNQRKNRIPDYQKLILKTGLCFKATESAFPHLIEELKGMSDGAGVDIKDYFFMNNREVYDEAEIWDSQFAVNPDHCTIAVSFGKNGTIVGHNEDWSLEALNQMYVLKATIGGNTFLGLQYADTIAGVVATINNWGLVQCINDLYQINSGVGVPKNFLARAVLDCKSLDEVENLIKNTKRASGFNHVLVQGNEVRNFEIAGNQIDVIKTTDKPFVHTNHYLSDKIGHLEKFHTKSSEERYQRAKELVKPNMTEEEMKALLSDTKNNEYPICRADETVGSLVLLPNEKEVYVCYGHPCAGEYIKYQI